MSLRFKDIWVSCALWVYNLKRGKNKVHKQYKAIQEKQYRQYRQERLEEEGSSITKGRWAGFHLERKHISCRLSGIMLHTKKGSMSRYDEQTASA